MKPRDCEVPGGGTGTRFLSAMSPPGQRRVSLPRTGPVAAEGAAAEEEEAAAGARTGTRAGTPRPAPDMAVGAAEAEPAAPSALGTPLGRPPSPVRSAFSGPAVCRSFHIAMFFFSETEQRSKRCVDWLPSERSYHRCSYVTSCQLFPLEFRGDLRCVVERLFPWP